MLVVRGSRVVLLGAERPAAIHIDDGRFRKITTVDDVPAGADVFEAGDRIVAPGLVDTHVHVNEPGRTEWEGFDTATRAAAAGGVTTIVDMPLNSIPATTTTDALYKKRRAAAAQCHVDVGFWGGIVPGNERELPRLAEAGVRGFKCFLAPSGVFEFPAVDESDLRRALRHLPGTEFHPYRTLLVHAEDPAHLRAPSGDSRSYADYLATRSAEAEASAIDLLGRLSTEFRVVVHIVHVSSAEGVRRLRAWRERGVFLTAETCPHYLTFTDQDVPDDGVVFKCAPPIRTSEHREALWTELARGGTSCVGMIASDHSPAPPSMKTGGFMTAWGGIASIELALAAVWTEARVRGFSPADVSRWMSTEPAWVARLNGRKGNIRASYDADLVVWDPDAEFVVDAARLQQRHKLTPYAGRRLRGVVTTTFLRGRRIWDDGALVSERSGQVL